ncbi:efflux RND transporter periplasmic adaptor subunit [Neobacillus sp. PS3-34]|uniref:HlyD family secretion protein n=1 Tax=Neobacillus sp. PS3-34 TaxID=3070678 RepID=UPI0027E11CD8|nr:efflux RND transporter periplasmic adaptor subunit [Neobacillus sp. PS3-34]WML47960.1 efflux RND transporter periplasmic adaptor subunit [Neobacillus sp. PS3-34]
MNAKRLIFFNIVLLIILVGGGLAGYAYYNKSVNYITTDNAQISGQQITIAAPANGKLTDWNGKVGDKFRKDAQIGTVVSAGAGTAGPSGINITVPENGTVVQSNAVKDSFVGAGAPLALMYDLDNLWVTANIEETTIDEVEVGQDVDVYVDAFPNNSLKGKVEKIGLATSGTFSLLPSSNSTGNYTKVTQVIPVRVAIDDYRGLQLVPGMNVTVRIHK